MKKVSGLSGVDSVAMDSKDKKLTVTGDVDPVTLVAKLRKICSTEILSVGPAKEPEKKKEEPKKEEPKKPDDKKKEDASQKAYQAYIQHYSQYPYQQHPPIVPYHQNPYQQYPPMGAYYAKSVEEDPNACVIC
ncbi:unnamed protein product [Ilex paraguariensis]|uniref:HMA domain-containing protein n=1 Tax=Ilex paraguariensis TaxID=185542 RepID=A0ABC8UVJ1_9AQUA